MSRIFVLVCPETKKSIWIGQGSGAISTIYSEDEEVMENLIGFLDEHQNKEIRFMDSELAGDLYGELKEYEINE